MCERGAYVLCFRVEPHTIAISREVSKFHAESLLYFSTGYINKRNTFNLYLKLCFRGCTFNRSDPSKFNMFSFVCVNVLPLKKKKKTS